MNRNCLSYWFPILRRTGKPVPPTAVVRTQLELVRFLDGEEPPGFRDFIGELAGAARELGGFPCFLRTGQASFKHQWRQTCFVPDSEELPRHIAALVESSECAGMLGLPYDVWAVRKLLPLKTSFTAFDGFPVNKERRYFIGGGKVLCAHPYWPEKSIEIGSRPQEADWKPRLAELNREDDLERELLGRWSAEISLAFDGEWSLDWAQDVYGQWWAIDMAQAHESFHWLDCPNCPAEMKQCHAAYQSVFSPTTWRSSTAVASRSAMARGGAAKLVGSGSKASTFRPRLGWIGCGPD